MLWAAFLPPTDLSATQRAQALQAISIWCLQFTPRVARIAADSEGAAVVMEVSASLRLFGGKRALADRVRREASVWGIRQLAWAPNSLAAVALARSGQSNGFHAPLDRLLDRLPCEVLEPVGRHAATLARMGCLTLGDVRRLPRGGLNRRFSADLLPALDQAYGLRPEAHDWQTVPEFFSARLELMNRVDTAPELMGGASRLLMQLGAWLCTRHAGVTAITLRWLHDTFRARDAGAGGELTVRTAEPMRDVDHLGRLLSEHLAKVELAAAVADLELVATEVTERLQSSGTLLPDAKATRASLDLALERISARLGPHNVVRPVLLEDHRSERMTQWQEAIAHTVRRAQPARAPLFPQPIYLLSEPLRLATRESQPLYQGEVELLLGPHRVEYGWFDRGACGQRLADDPGQHLPEDAGPDGLVCRDYWVAMSEHAGVLYVFQTRLASEDGAWYLHGVFA